LLVQRAGRNPTFFLFALGVIPGRLPSFGCGTVQLKKKKNQQILIMCTVNALSSDLQLRVLKLHVRYGNERYHRVLFILTKSVFKGWLPIP